MENHKTLTHFYKNKRVFIPGGAGFIGSNLTIRLVGYRAKVTVVDPIQDHCGGDIGNLAGVKDRIRFVNKSVENYLRGAKSSDYDIVFNCIGLTDHRLGMKEPFLDYRLNCGAGLMLLEWLKKRSRPSIVSMGSRGQYGRTAARSIDESQTMAALDIQAVHKTTLEGYGKIFSEHYGANVTFLRATNIYGPNQRFEGPGIGFVGELIKDALTKKEVTIYGSLDRTKDLLYVDDAVEAILLTGAIRVGGFSVFNLGGGGCKISELVASLKLHIEGFKVRVCPFPEDVKYLDSGDAVLDTGALTRLTRWMPTTDLCEGIRLTVEYFKRRTG